jgi:hypothetical protein
MRLASHGEPVPTEISRLQGHQPQTAPQPYTSQRTVRSGCEEGPDLPIPTPESSQPAGQQAVQAHSAQGSKGVGIEPQAMACL